MRIRRAIGLLLLLGSSGLPARAQDRLEPERGPLNERDHHWEYMAKLRATLLKDAPGYFVARMVCLPSFRREWMVTVVREGGEGRAPDDKPTYSIEYVEVGTQVWGTEDVGSIRLDRTRAGLDPETAEAVGGAWLRMLREIRYPEERRDGKDGVTYHFSRAVPFRRRDQAGGFEEGQIWSPREEAATVQLVAIGEGLKRYTTARPEDREKIAAEIRAEAKRLRERLDNRRRPE